MSRLIAATIGRILPKYRTFSEWVEMYDEILTTRPFSPKTLGNRRNSLRYLCNALGPETVSSIKPHQIAQLVRKVHADHPHTARRVLIEARDCFSEAVAYGWVDSNPAAAVRHMPSRVARKRLSLDDWLLIYDHAKTNMPPWVSRMLSLALVTGQRRGDLQKMRFCDVSDEHLHIKQQKTGALIRIPISLRLDVIGIRLAGVIEDCRRYAKGDEFLIRKSTGAPLTLASLSARFETAREGALGAHASDGSPASLHECRSLSERLYRKQGIDTKTLLGHRHQRMTDLYNDSRGLDAGQWQTLKI